MIEEKIIYRDSRGKIEEVYFGSKTIRYCITWMNGEELWTNDLPLAHQLLASKGEARQMTMRYLSVCSGIEAATSAWHHLGWEPVAFSEIEPFPSAVLKHHYPDVPNWGDMTKYQTWPDAAIDILVGGTPCQSFSIAGLRKGLEDPRGNLMLTFLGIAQRYRPRYVVWENVPGVLSSNGGRDFGTFLAALGELGYGWAYRVLDAQWFGVAQRRRRVFVVGCLGDQRRAAQVLFERESVQRNPPPSRETRQGVARGVGGGPEGGSISGAVTRKWAKGSGGPAGDECYNMVAQPVAHALRGEGFDASEDGTGRGTPIVPVAQPVATAMQVRRLTPVECERLQGFHDNHTNIPWKGKAEAPDGPRYKALGNSMAVPVMRWIGERINA